MCCCSVVRALISPSRPLCVSVNSGESLKGSSCHCRRRKFLRICFVPFPSSKKEKQSCLPQHWPLSVMSVFLLYNKNTPLRYFPSFFSPLAGVSPSLCLTDPRQTFLCSECGVEFMFGCFEANASVDQIQTRTY